MSSEITTNDAYFEEPKESAMRSVLEFILELIKVVVICAGIIIVVRWFLFQPFYVKGPSMEPNYYDGEYLIIYQLPYRFPDRFDAFDAEDRGRVVVFRPPNDPSQFYIKRMIGLPGERVKIDDGHITIYNDTHPNGYIVDESYIPQGVKTVSGGNNDITLGVDQIFVLGDNRNRSLDSRSKGLGPIPIENVVGEPVLRGWPFDKLGFLKKPTYAGY